MLRVCYKLSIVIAWDAHLGGGVPCWRSVSGRCHAHDTARCSAASRAVSDCHSSGLATMQCIFSHFNDFVKCILGTSEAHLMLSSILNGLNHAIHVLLHQRAVENRLRWDAVKETVYPRNFKGMHNPQRSRCHVPSRGNNTWGVVV